MAEQAVESIKQLKYAYFRLLDTKQFEALGQLFAEDGTTSYEGGELAQHGRAQIVEFLTASLSDPTIVHLHNGHHPEIAVGDDGTASGTWYLEDKVIFPAHDLVLQGSALYDDVYVLVDGEWRIKHTGYVRIFEERRRFTSGELISFTSRFQPEPSR